MTDTARSLRAKGNDDLADAFGMFQRAEKPKPVPSVTIESMRDHSSMQDTWVVRWCDRGGCTHTLITKTLAEAVLFGVERLLEYDMVKEATTLADRYVYTHQSDRATQAKLAGLFLKRVAKKGDTIKWVEEREAPTHTTKHRWQRQDDGSHLCLHCGAEVKWRDRLFEEFERKSEPGAALHPSDIAAPGLYWFLPSRESQALNGCPDWRMVRVTCSEDGSLWFQEAGGDAKTEEHYLGAFVGPISKPTTY